MEKIFSKRIFIGMVTLFIVITCVQSINADVGIYDIRSNCNNEIFFNTNNEKLTWIFYNDEDFPTGVSILDWFSEFAFSGENLVICQRMI